MEKRKKPAPGSARMGGVSAMEPSERPRERMLALGARVLTNAELVAIVVGSGTAGWSALDVGRSLTANGLRRLCKATASELAESEGIGAARACALAAAIELGRRALRAEAPHRPVVSDSVSAYRVLRPAMEGLPREVFHMLLLDGQNRLLRDVRVAEGDLKSCSVPPREVVKRALDEGAARVIFAHNHPSGDATPSSDDVRLTDVLEQALELTGVQVVDHLVLGEGTFHSLTEGRTCRAAA